MTQLVCNNSRSDYKIRGMIKLFKLWKLVNIYLYALYDDDDVMSKCNYIINCFPLKKKKKKG